MQMIASSGYEPSAIVSKTKSSKPPIELSFLPIARVNNTCFFKDLWQGIKFSKKMIYPVESIDITSRGTSYPLNLQILHDSFGMMECLCSDWRRQSRQYTRVVVNYQKDEEMNLKKSENIKTAKMVSHNLFNNHDNKPKCDTENFCKELSFRSVLNRLFKLPTNNDYLVK